MRSANSILMLLLFILGLGSCSGEDPLFERVKPGRTGITFSNRITENEQYNILAFEYIYNGGGAAVGDFNNDGLQDLFFSGNMVDNRLYLNRGNWKFRDVSATAGIEGADRWSSGVALVDINNDGRLDIYVCATAYEPGMRRANQLFVNQGDQGGESPVFIEMAEEYGIADTSYTTAAAFFDYDNDGDLDLYLAVNHFDAKLTPNGYWYKKDPRAEANTDRLYENRYDSIPAHPVFREISAQAGIARGGFSLGLNIVDIDRDGWKDIYVSNDYNSPDMLFMNNRNGTFTDRSGEYLKHTCYSAMGMNIADMNNDGLADIFVLDMLPEDNFRRKVFLQPYNYVSYLNNETFGYTYQHVRNVLQLNQGTRPDNGQLLFSDVSLYSGIHATDWSWTPMLADFDHDQFRDMIITNGFPKDITDHDFGDFMTMRGNYMDRVVPLTLIPSVKINNYAYKNQLTEAGGIPRFLKVSKDWGIDEASFSSSAACGDLDNDGDLDYVVNNINDSAFVFRNMLLEKEPEKANWLQMEMKGGEHNLNGLGAIVEIYYNGKQQMWENTPYRGYHATVQMGAHFGLGGIELLDSVRVEWPGGKVQVLHKVAVNQVLTLDYRDAIPEVIRTSAATVSVFKEVSRDWGLDFIPPERDYIDYNVQPLLLHKLSQLGPGMAVSDVNGDGLEDFYIGGSRFYKGRFFLQLPEGGFLESDLLPGEEGEGKREEELGVLFFDADNDLDEDLYLVSGGYEYEITDSSYRDRLFLNENGRFLEAESALPDLLSSGSCVKAADFDRDGDLDLFVGGRVHPANYPLPVNSYLLINDGKGNYSIGNEALIPGLNEVGLISDALWTDFNNDGWVDLLLAGEWMPLTLLINNEGKFERMIPIGGGQATGWWNSLASADFDMDGDMDYVAGNLGSNSLLKASVSHPVSLYAGDYNNDNSLDLIPTSYFTNEQDEPGEYPFFGRTDMEKQLHKLRELFPEHKAFGRATIEELMERLPDATTLLLKANYQLTSWVENRGNEEFVVHPLPPEVQLAPVFSILTGDFTGDALPDILLTGNDYGNEIREGRYDALNGMLLQGDGKGNFNPLSMQNSGIIIPGDGKSLVKLQAGDGSLLVISAQNRGPLGLFRSSIPYHSIELEPHDVAAIVHLQESLSYREEFYYGNSYLSQSGRRLWLPSYAQYVTLIDYNGEKRRVTMPVND
ncbi:MAG: VCBS repeat-containing protein [Bacteroidales bacterium]|nr:VCBS repeat-containing protein [Bacteroidales bacterium]